MNTVVNKDLFKNYTIVPNIVDEMEMSPQAYRLYGHLRRLSGIDSTQSDETTRQLAESCRMSTRAVSDAKKELVSIGLITIKEEPMSHGGRPRHIIFIEDIWQRNSDHFHNPPSFHMKLGDGEASYTGKLASYTGATSLINGLINNNNSAAVSEKTETARVRGAKTDTPDEIENTFSPAHPVTDEIVTEAGEEDSYTDTADMPEQAPTPPQTPPPPLPRKRKLTQRQSDIAEMESHFAEVAGTKLPLRDTQKQRQESAVRWWQPLERILRESDGDVDVCMSAISRAVREMDEKHLDISAPQSVEKKVISILAASKRNGSAKRKFKVVDGVIYNAGGL